jgi:putative transposase
MARTHPWEVSDALWERVEPLIPPAPSHAKGGRPRILALASFCRHRLCLARLPSSGMRDLRELGASSTIHDRFQEWEQAGFFKALWQAGLSIYDQLQGLEWEWQAIDGAMTKAPLIVSLVAHPRGFAPVFLSVWCCLMRRPGEVR